MLCPATHHSNTDSHDLFRTLPKLLQHAKQLNQVDKISPIFSALNKAILRESDSTYLTSLYQSYAECLDVLSSPLPSEITTMFEDATEFQVSGYEEIRKLRCEVAQYTLSERRQEYETQQEEDEALTAIFDALTRLDPRHRLLSHIGIARSYKINKTQRS